MFVADQNIFDSIQVVRHASETDAAAALAALGQTPSDPNPLCLFRGQVSRQPPREWPPIDYPNAKKHALQMEKLLPTDYRDLEEGLEAGEARADLELLYGDRPAQIRSTMTLALMQQHSSWDDAAVQGWYSALPQYFRADNLLSIGQHYGLKTHLMDWTSDWQAALWFASHPWGSGGYVAGGEAVIYQLSVAGLVAAEQTANNMLGLTQPNEIFRHVDIRDTPPVLASRASAQSGFSARGIESPCELQELIRCKALTVHVFPRGNVATSANSLTKAQLVPPNEEMGNLFDEAKKGTALFQTAIQWIQQQYPTLNASITDQQIIFP